MTVARKNETRVEFRLKKINNNIFLIILAQQLFGADKNIAFWRHSGGFIIITWFVFKKLAWLHIQTSTIAFFPVIFSKMTKKYNQDWPTFAYWKSVQNLGQNSARVNTAEIEMNKFDPFSETKKGINVAHA